MKREAGACLQGPGAKVAVIIPWETATTRRTKSVEGARVGV